MKERRLYSRILYSAKANMAQADNSWQTEIADLSLKGLLLKLPKGWRSFQNKTYNIHFKLNGANESIFLTANLVNQDENFLHFAIKNIDIDSVSFLKRLIELNVGDSTLLHRELSQLADLK